jgi:hypothetical protein
VPQARAALAADRERFEAQRLSERAELDRAWQARGARRGVRGRDAGRQGAEKRTHGRTASAHAVCVCVCARPQALYETRDAEASLREDAVAAVREAAAARVAATAALADAAEARRAASATFATVAPFAPQPPFAPQAAAAPIQQQQQQQAQAPYARVGGSIAPSPPPPPSPATLFAVGGLSRAAAPLSSAESFDPAAGAWRPLPPLSCARGYCAAAAAGGGGRRGAATLYALGGSHGGAPLDSCEALGAGGTAWRRIASMSTARVWHAAAVIADDIYVVGGYDGTRALGAVEAYSADTDAPRGMWRQLAVRCRCHAHTHVHTFPQSNTPHAHITHLTDAPTHPTHALRTVAGSSAQRAGRGVAARPAVRGRWIQRSQLFRHG